MATSELTRKAIAWIVSPPLYAAGHATSIVMRWADFLGHLYPIYNRLMCWSDDIETWAGIEIMWRTCAEPDDAP